MSYHAHLGSTVAASDDFRRVLFTGKKSQLVAMSIPAGGEIGEEVHHHVEQTLYVQSGKGRAVVGEAIYEVGPGDVVVVTPGSRHNVTNTGDTPLKIATVYAPPNHIDGRVHRTKADADADEEDEAFGDKP